MLAPTPETYFLVFSHTNFRKHPCEYSFRTTFGKLQQHMCDRKGTPEMCENINEKCRCIFIFSSNTSGVLVPLRMLHWHSILILHRPNRLDHLTSLNPEVLAFVPISELR